MDESLKLVIERLEFERLFLKKEFQNSKLNIEDNKKYSDLLTKSPKLLELAKQEFDPNQPKPTKKEIEASEKIKKLKEKLKEIEPRRNALYDKLHNDGLTAEEQAELDEIHKIEFSLLEFCKEFIDSVLKNKINAEKP